MSSRRKGGGSQKTKGQRLDDMARKREERAVRAAHRKEKKMAEHMADDENFVSFAAQLGKMGLQLRDIQGDGNCLFRALGDQFEGHGRNHYKHRLEVCQYMQDHREDFEPFVEDDVPFDRHISNLKKMGTYAGNDCIVSFARLHNVNIVIHQFNSPSLYISGGNNPTDRALHISYHNGDHYCSVRKMGDNTETPACIKASEPEKPSSLSSMCNGHQRYSPEPDYSFESFNGNGYDSDYDNVPHHHHHLHHSHPQPYHQPAQNHHRSNREYVARAIRGKSDVEDYVMKVTNCMDQRLVQQTLEDHFYDVDSSVDLIVSLMAASNKANNHYDDQSLHSNHSDSGIWSENGTATRLFGQPEQLYATVDKSKGAKPKQRPLSAKEIKKQKKLEKKQKSMDRHRLRLLGVGAQNGDPNGEEGTDEETIISNLGMVKI